MMGIQGLAPGTVVACPTCQAPNTVPQMQQPVQMQQIGLAPQQQMMTSTNNSADLGARLAGVDRVHVEQSWYYGECCNILNHYNLYANDRKGAHLAIVLEEASCCEKAWCAPNHSFTLKLAFPENPDDVKYTFERRGIFAGKPCLCCCAFGDSCQDEITLHEGNVQGEAGALTNPNPLYTARQASASESLFAPMINIISEKNSDVQLSTTGPFIFGGCSEFCCSSTFNATDAQGGNRGFCENCGQKPSATCAVRSALILTGSNLILTRPRTPPLNSGWPC